MANVTQVAIERLVVEPLRRTVSVGHVAVALELSEDAGAV
jgi:hypothetical protein